MSQIIKGFVPPAQHNVPLTDVDAWRRHAATMSQLFDRMWLLRAQSVMAHPHGIDSGDGNWLSLPIVNLAGMAVDERSFARWTPNLYQAGHFWRPKFTGEYHCEDYVLVNGQPVWRYVVQAEMDLNGTFVSFKGFPSEAYNRPWLDWFTGTYPGYTGVLGMEFHQEINYANNPETGRSEESERVDRCIGLYLRPNTDFLTFYGPEWFAAVDQLYGDPEGGWSLDTPSKAAMVIPIRIPRDSGSVFEVDMTVVNGLDCEHISLDFVSGESIHHQPNDPWTYRLALVGSVEETKAEAAADKLAPAIGVSGAVAVPRVTDQ